MVTPPRINYEKLYADAARQAEVTSDRGLSKAATGGKNPNFWRDFRRGQDKRLSADNFVGLAYAIGSPITDYIIGAEEVAAVPSEAVLTATLGILLDSVGIDPNEDARAHKIAVRFPDALRRIAALHASDGTAPEIVPDATAPGHAANLPKA